VASLQDTQITPASGGIAGSNPTVLGVQFIVLETTWVDAIAWYNNAASQANLPNNIKLWRKLSGDDELLTTVSGIVMASTVGWHWSPFDDPVELITGETYVATVEIASGKGWNEVPSGSVVAPASPFDFAANRRAWRDGSSGPVNQESNGNLFGVDVRILAGPPPGGGVGDEGDPPTNENLTARLAEWLSADPDVNTKEGDLPWLLKVGQVALQSGLDEAVGMLDALIALGIAVRFGDIDDKLLAVGAVLDEFRIESTAGHVETQTAVGDQITAAVVTLADQIAAGPADLRAAQDHIPLGGTGWTAVDTVVGSGSFYWDQPADRYVLTITEYGTHRAYNTVGGVPYWLHRGFWARMNGDRVGHYSPICGHKHELYEVGSRLPGVLIGLDADLEWTLTAWDYTGA
jgi:hypothetical protein